MQVLLKGKIRMENKINLNIKEIAVNKLRSAGYNPRTFTDNQFNDLCKSLERFGMVEPVIVNSASNRKNIIIGGHFRLMVAKKLGFKKVPVIYLNIPNIEKEKELNIRLNKNVGEWDLKLLATFDEKLLENVGFEKELLNNIFQEAILPEKDELPKYKKTKIKIGDIFLLGRHRLMCGDCTIKENVDRLMDGKKADMVFTDPPYGINIVNKITSTIGGGGKVGFVGVRGKVAPRKYKIIEGDDKPFDPAFLLDKAEKVMIFGANNFSDKLPCNSHWLVWDKKGENAERINTFSDAELIWTNIKKKIVLIYRYKWSGLLREGNRNLELKERVHPTQKPVGLISLIINDYVEINEIILDLFLGSGSTLIACEQTNRICYGMEIDPQYCQVIIDRWENYTKNKIKKIRSEEHTV